MKSIICLSLLLIGLQTACDNKDQEDNKKKLESILTGYFDGVAAMDINRLNEMTTDDYILFEGGQVWNNDSLINSMKKRPNVTFKFKLDNFNIRVDNQSGRMTYFNHGDVFVNDTLKRSLEWLESATFRKVSGEWKMEFLHSTDRKK